MTLRTFLRYFTLTLTDDLDFGSKERGFTQKKKKNRYMRVKYESSITYRSKVMANVKVFADKQRDKRTGQKQFTPNLPFQTLLFSG